MDGLRRLPTGAIASLLALALIACAGRAADPVSAPETSPSGPGSPAHVADVEALAAQLPAGADRCIVLSPGAVPADQQAGFALVSRAEPLAFLSELDVLAYAEASRSRRGHPRARVILLRTAATRARVRALLSTETEWDVRFGGGSLRCTPDDCPTRVRFLDDHTVRIAQGEWITRSGSRGVELACRALREQAPRAAEWSASRGQSLRPELSPTLPLGSSRVLSPSARRLRLSRTHRMPNGDLAAALAQEASGVSADRDPSEQLISVRREGREVRIDSVLAWDVLDGRVRDLETLAAAELEAERLWDRRPTPDQDAAVDVRDRAALRGHLAYRAALLAGAQGSERRPLVESLRALLERSVRAHPGDAPLALSYVRLVVREGGDFADAARVSAAHRDDAGAGADFALLHRWALARADLDAFAALLVAEEVVRPALAAEAAASIVAMLEYGHAYRDAEAAFLTLARVMRRVAITRTRAVPPLRVALPVLFEGLLSLRHLAGVMTPLRAVLHASDGALADLRPGPGRMRVGDAWLLHVEPGDGATARAVGRALASAAPAGRLRLWLPVRAGGGRVLQLEGETVDGHLTLDRADTRTAAVDLLRIGEHLLDPLAALSGGGFSVPVVGAVETERMRRMAARAFGLPCVADGHAVRCRVAATARRRAREAILALSAKPLSIVARRLWGADGR